MHNTRTPRRPPGTGRVPGYGGDRTRTPRRPRPGGLPSRIAPALPAGPAATPVVQICCKGPDRAETPEEKR